MSVRLALLAAAAVAVAAQPSVRDKFDCKMRAFALEYAATLQPWRHASSFHEIADALNGTPEKAAGCVINATGPREAPGAARFRQASLPTAARSIYVDPVNGVDGASGELTNPVKTIFVALAAIRVNATARGSAIILRAGTHYTPTISLTAADSGLTIQVRGMSAVRGATASGCTATTPPAPPIQCTARRSRGRRCGSRVPCR